MGKSYNEVKQYEQKKNGQVMTIREKSQWDRQKFHIEVIVAEHYQ
jgi:hypothetical protein